MAKHKFTAGLVLVFQIKLRIIRRKSKFIKAVDIRMPFILFSKNHYLKIHKFSKGLSEFFHQFLNLSDKILRLVILQKLRSIFFVFSAQIIFFRFFQCLKV